MLHPIGFKDGLRYIFSLVSDKLRAACVATFGYSKRLIIRRCETEGANS